VSTIAAMGRALRRAHGAGGDRARGTHRVGVLHRAACGLRPGPGRPGELPVGVQLVAGRTDRVLAAASLVGGDGMSYVM
jgi:hypothetical protein